jgi:hypothetical protein
VLSHSAINQQANVNAIRSSETSIVSSGTATWRAAVPEPSARG